MTQQKDYVRRSLRTSSLSVLTKHTQLWAIALILIPVAGLSTVSRAPADNWPGRLFSESAPIRPHAQGQAGAQDVLGLVIPLRPTGFVPAELEITDGRYLLIVENRCGIRDLTFHLDREGGERLHEAQEHKLQWKEKFNLRPGSYVLSVLEHPEWHCVIKVRSA